MRPVLGKSKVQDFSPFLDGLEDCALQTTSHWGFEVWDAVTGLETQIAFEIFQGIFVIF